MRTLYGLLALALPVILISPAFAEDIFIVTELGNMFPVEEVHVSNDENGDVAEKALESISSAITDQSRIIDLDVNGNVILHKPSGFEVDGFRPYLDVDNNVRKIAYIFDGAATKEIDIPSLYADYEFESTGGLPDLDRLTKEFDYTTEDGYAYDSSSYQIRHMGASTSHSVDSDSHTLNLDGTGRVFIGIPRSGLTDTTSPMVFNVFSNSVSENDRIRLVDSPYDLTTFDHDPDLGFAIMHCDCDLFSIVHSILVGSVSDSEKFSVFSYDQNIEIKVRHGQRGFIRHSHGETRHITSYEDFTQGVHTNGYHEITGGDIVVQTLIEPYTVSTHRQDIFDSVVYNNVTSYVHTIYDSLPAKTRSMTPERTWNLSSSDKTYLVADLENSDIGVRVNHIKPGQTDLLHISNTPENMPYSLEINGKKVVDGGISTEDGVIEITSSQIPWSVLDPEMPVVDDVKLVLYTDSDSATITNTDTPTVYDIYNHQFVADPGISNSMYSATAYVKVPFSGAASVSDVSLDETLPLPYLSGEYELGESMYVPFVANHKVIHMILNGTQKVQIEYGNNLGQREMFLIGDKTSTKNEVYPYEVREGSVTVVASAYAIASTDGTMNALFNSEVTGTVKLSNEYYYDVPPPPPPPPPRRDPLTNTIDVYVNGDLVKSVQLGYSDSPTSTSAVSIEDLGSMTVVTRSVDYIYDDLRYFGHASVPVESGDIVEFYVINNVMGFIDSHQAPAGWTLLDTVGNVDAEVTIKSTYIQTGM